MNEKIKDAIETALNAFENYEKDRNQFYGMTKEIAVKKLKSCLGDSN